MNERMFIVLIILLGMIAPALMVLALLYRGRDGPNRPGGLGQEPGRRGRERAACHAHWQHPLLSVRPRALK